MTKGRLFSQPELRDKSLDREAVVNGDALEDASERADPNRLMIGDDFVMLAALLGRHANVRTALAIDLIPEGPQRLDQFRAGDVARQFHGVSTSSRTKWSRMTFGATMVSS